MSRQSITQSREQGGDRYTLVASVRSDFDAFSDYMAEKGVFVKDGVKVPGIHSADYRSAGLENIKVRYQGHTKILMGHDGNEIPVDLGPLLSVSGPELELVEAEADRIIKRMGEVEDPGSVQRYVALEDRF